MWLRVDAAVALGRVTGGLGEVSPVLAAAWRENRHTRLRVAEFLAELGPLGADGEDGAAMVPLLRAELARARRHNASAGLVGGSDHDIHDDERLLALCRQALGPDGGDTAP